MTDHKRVPELHVFMAQGVSGDQWVVHCSTCGWEIRGSGDTPRRDEEAKNHRCPPEEPSD